MTDVIRLKVSDNDLVVKPEVDTVEEVIKEIEVPIPAEDVDKVLDRSITEITTNATTIGMYALAYCNKLTSIKGDNVRVLKPNALYYCESLTSLDLPNLQELQPNSLYECPLQKTMVFPELLILNNANFQYAVTETIIAPKLTTVKGRNFYRSKVKDFNAPLIEVLPDYFMQEAFRMNKAVFPNCTEVGNYAFSSCGATLIDLGKPTQIGSNAFNYVKGDVYIRTPTVCKMAGATTNFNGRFFVPSELVDQYKVADNWSTWANQIFAIEEE